MNARYVQKIAATIANDSKVSSAIDVTPYKNFAVELPTATVGLASAVVSVFISGSDTPTGTFRQCETTDAGNIVSASAGNVIATVNHYVPRFIKVNTTANTATAVGYAAVVHCWY